MKQDHGIRKSLLFLLLACLLAGACTSDDARVADTGPPLPESFSFFDVGVNTALNRDLRGRLESLLGDDAVATQNTMDLRLNTEPGFMARHFSGLDTLNRNLNMPAGERVEHNTTQLTYRYAANKDLPFSYVELLFSRFTDMPLLIRVYFDDDTLDVRATLEEKYGPPETVAWEQPNGRTLSWGKNGDHLFYCFVPNQFGVPEYRVSIYFTQRIQDLLETENKIRRQGAAHAVDSGKSVF